MKTCIDGLSQTISLNGNVPSPLAGHPVSRAVRLITSIGVCIYYRELASLRYWSILQPEPQDLIEHRKSGSFAELPTFAAVVELR
jgi:hypothetical protein